MKQKRFVAYFSHTQIIGFTKDGVLLPLYLAKLLDMSGTLIPQHFDLTLFISS